MLNLRFLGEPRVTDGRGIPLHPVERSPKILALLAYLAATPPGTAHRRELVISMLWPERDHDHARHALRQLLSRVRRIGGHDCFACDGEETLCLNARRVRSDVAALRQALEHDRLETALGLYGGPFMEGFHVADAPGFERWAAEQRQAFQRRAVEAAASLARRAARRDAFPEERRWLVRTLEMDPYCKAASERLIELLLAAGEVGAAMAEQERLTRRFEEDLGLTPELSVGLPGR